MRRVRIALLAVHMCGKIQVHQGSMRPQLVELAQSIELQTNEWCGIRLIHPGDSWYDRCFAHGLGACNIPPVLYWHGYCSITRGLRGRVVCSHGLHTFRKGHESGKAVTLPLSRCPLLEGDRVRTPWLKVCRGHLALRPRRSYLRLVVLLPLLHLTRRQWLGQVRSSLREEGILRVRHWICRPDPRVSGRNVALHELDPLRDLLHRQQLCRVFFSPSLSTDCYRLWVGLTEPLPDHLFCGLIVQLSRQYPELLELCPRGKADHLSSHSIDDGRIRSLVVSVRVVR